MLEQQQATPSKGHREGSLEPEAKSSLISLSCLFTLLSKINFNLKSDVRRLPKTRHPYDFMKG
jgi:hypothetical protein